MKFDNSTVEKKLLIKTHMVRHSVSHFKETKFTVPILISLEKNLCR